MICLDNAIEAPLALLGVVVSEAVGSAAQPALEAARAAVLERRRAAPTAADERVRQAVRDLLRRGRYKPTGRGKPASEYLLRTAQEGAFPSIHPAVFVDDTATTEIYTLSLLDDLPIWRAQQCLSAAGR